jgi:hypothetical protein
MKLNKDTGSIGRCIGVTGIRKIAHQSTVQVPREADVPGPRGDWTRSHCGHLGVGSGVFLSPSYTLCLGEVLVLSLCHLLLQALPSRSCEKWGIQAPQLCRSEPACSQDPGVSHAAGAALVWGCWSWCRVLSSLWDSSAAHCWYSWVTTCRQHARC